MSEWQPIASAPKDGTKILLASLGVMDTGPMINTAHWMCFEHGHLSSKIPCPAPDCRYGWSGGLYGIGGEHIAWMPLPEPPEK